MNKIILSNEEEMNEELMWQPTTGAAIPAEASAASSCCKVTGVTLSAASLCLEVNDGHTLTATIIPSNATNKAVAWSSSDTGVATVSASGLVCAKSPGTATITVKTRDGGYRATCEVTVKPVTVDVTGVELSSTSLSMKVNDSYLLTASVKPSNATNKKVTWESSDETVATVSSGGLVCAKAAGMVKITAKTEDGGFSRTCMVTVVPDTVAVTDIRLLNTSLALGVNDSYQLTATVSPSNATNKRITWTSSDQRVATVRTSGLVCTKAAGTTTITASCGGYRATCTITVTEASVGVTCIDLSQTSLSLEVEDVYLLVANITPANATNKTVIWTSCSPEVASVSENGLVTAKTTGSVKIRAVTEDGNFSKTCWVTVVEKGILHNVEVESVTITSQEKTYHLLKMGESLGLAATVMPENATNKEIVWSSHDASIVAVDSNGMLYPKKEGEVKITATAATGGKTADYWIKVIPSVLIEGILIDKVCKGGNIYQLEAVTTPENATGEIIWTSSDPTIVSIDDNGTATRWQSGEVTITATAKTTGKDIKAFEEEKNEGYGEESQEGLFSFVGSIVDNFINLVVQGSLTVIDDFIKDKQFKTPTSASDKLINFIKTYETFVDKPYSGLDSQNRTVGYGHVITKEDGTKYDNGITEAEATKLLQSDLNRVVYQYFNLWIEETSIIFTQNQYDALVDFTFNTGHSWITKYEDLRNILLSEEVTYEAMYDEFMTWIKVNGVKSEGLYRRRMDELDIFFYGEYNRDYPSMPDNV